MVSKCDEKQFSAKISEQAKKGKKTVSSPERAAHMKSGAENKPKTYSDGLVQYRQSV
jgi:hypothetical protein